MAPKISVTLLGTGSAIPSPSRGHAGVHISFQGASVLFDCGEGTQTRMQIAGIPLVKTGPIFITHFHSDHFLGLPGLVSSMELLGRAEPLQIFCPRGAGKPIRRLLALVAGKTGYKISVKELPLPKKPKLAFRGEGYSIFCARAAHSLPTLAVSFVEDDRYHLLADRLADRLTEKLPEKMRGAQLAKMKARLIKAGKRECFDIERGRRITYSSDTAYSESVVRLARGADLLIHEATFAEANSDHAIKYKHSTAADAARAAREAGAKKLILTHFSNRIPDIRTQEAEARAIFPDTAAAEDLQVFEL